MLDQQYFVTQFTFQHSPVRPENVGSAAAFLAPPEIENAVPILTTPKRQVVAHETVVGHHLIPEIERHYGTGYFSVEHHLPQVDRLLEADHREVGEILRRETWRSQSPQTRAES